MNAVPRGAGRIIVALDVPSMGDALAALARLPREITWVKVGLELFSAEGPGIVAMLRRQGYRVFVDLKLHDIPNTMARAAAALTRLGAAMATVHCDAGVEALRSAREAAAEAAQASGGPRPLLAGVTVLTSCDEDRYRREVGWAGTLRDAVVHRARLAVEAGLDAIVCSPADLPAVRSALGSDAPVRFVCPGVRSTGGGPSWANEDQRRVATPGEAVRAGADWLVIGRPILAAGDPAAAVADIVAEIARAEGA